MINDADILLRISTINPKFTKSILSDKNGKLINTKNLFEDSSLSMDTSVSLKESLVDIFRLSGVNEDVQKIYRIVEPVSALLLKTGIDTDAPSIRMLEALNLFGGLKLSDNRTDSENIDYIDSQITINKLYPKDFGKLKTGGHDIPLREVMNSGDKITFNTSEDDKKSNRRKKLFIVGNSKDGKSVAQNSILYLNQIIENNSVKGAEGIIYHGECKFFHEEKLFSNELTIEGLCEGNFITNDNTELISSNYSNSPYGIIFRKQTDGWKLLVTERGIIEKEINFKSITNLTDTERSLPLPVMNEFVDENGNLKYENDVINWTANYRVDEMYYAKLTDITLTLTSESVSIRKFIQITNWNVNYDKSKNTIGLIFNSDLTTTTGEKLQLSDNYHIECVEIGTGSGVTYHQELLNINPNIPIDRDPLIGEIVLNLAFTESIEGNDS